MNRASYRGKWRKLIKAHGSLCFYCQEEPASSIDHIIPVSYGGNGSLDNLVPACMRCNLIAGDKVFDDVWQKQQYIIRKRKGKHTHAQCTECLLPFEYRYHSPSMFLCAECYALEYGTNHDKSKRWKAWLIDLESAGVLIDAHRDARLEIASIPSGELRRKRAFLILHKHMALSGVYREEKNMFAMQ
jgi:5-methylcytosine-specific restriction endonuclease McrA